MKWISLLVTLVFFLSACGVVPTPAPTPDIPATTAAYSNTMVAATLTAQPTPTLVPTETPAPSATPTLEAPTETTTLQPDSALTVTPDATQGINATPTIFEGTFAPGNTADLPTCVLLIVNVSGVKEIIVTITGTTDLRSQPVYYSYKVTNSAAINVIFPARYHVLVQIPNKRYMSLDFHQTNKDKTTLTVYLTKLAVHGP